jgi:hypothetical protein
MDDVVLLDRHDEAFSETIIEAVFLLEFVHVGVDLIRIEVTDNGSGR